MRFSIERWSPTPQLSLVGRMAGLSLALLALLASAAQASSSCPNELYRTGPGASLPDCRAYEMVTPPNKNGGEVDGGPVLEGTPLAPQQASLNGELVTYGSQTTFTEANPASGLVTSQYLSRRGPDGWSTQAITPEQNEPGGVLQSSAGALDFSAYWGFGEDLEHGFLLANDPAPVAGAPAHYYSPYVRDSATGVYHLLSTATPPVQLPGEAFKAENHGLWFEFAGMSTDGGRAAFSANDALTPEAVPGRTNLYESNDGNLELVSVLPDGEAVSGEQVESRITFGNPDYDQGGLSEDYQRVVSADGSRVIWTGPENKVYVGELIDGGTRRVTHGPLPGTYETASVDGSVVFTNYGRELYRTEISSTGELHSTDLTGPVGVLGVLASSEDGSYIYFATFTGLDNGEIGEDSFTIDAWHGGVTTLIANTNFEDYINKFLQPEDRVSSIHRTLERNTFRASPDGRYFVFESSDPLTGYDTKPLPSGVCATVSSFWVDKESPEANPTKGCVEVYEYDAQTGKLSCPSCNPRGLPPVGNSVLPMAKHNVKTTAGWQSETDQQRYLLDDGRVFFDSTDTLLPQASNTGKENVYEYEPSGIGSCQQEAGCLSLISSGTNNEDSLFMDASASGNDVFFTTRQRLVSQDGDEAIDLYDARVDGGLLAATPPPCGGEACRPPISAAPAIYGAPPSATFVGAGNPSQRPVPTTTAKDKSRSKAKKKRKRRRHKSRRKTGKKAARGSRAHGSSKGSSR